jgi:hypothetical protein
MTFSTTIYRKLRTGTALTLTVAAIAVTAGGAQGMVNRPAPASGLAAQAQGSIAGVTDARHAGLLLRHRGARGVDAGLISRPAPAEGIAANAPVSISAPAVDGPAEGFDYRDAFVGAIVAFAVVLLLFGAARLVQGHGRLVHR